MADRPTDDGAREGVDHDGTVEHPSSVLGWVVSATSEVIRSVRLDVPGDDTFERQVQHEATARSPGPATMTSVQTKLLHQPLDALPTTANTVRETQLRRDPGAAVRAPSALVRTRISGLSRSSSMARWHGSHVHQASEPLLETFKTRHNRATG